MENKKKDDNKNMLKEWLGIIIMAAVISIVLLVGPSIGQSPIRNEFQIAIIVILSLICIGVSIIILKCVSIFKDSDYGKIVEFFDIIDQITTLSGLIIIFSNINTNIIGLQYYIAIITIALKDLSVALRILNYRVNLKSQ